MADPVGAHGGPAPGPTDARTAILRVPNRDVVLEVGLVGTAGTVEGALAGSGGYYDAPLMLAMERRLRPDSVALDIGANVGTVALVLGALCPKGRVYAFEPAAVTFGHLAENLRRNGMAHVTPVRLGAWDAAGTLAMSFTPANPGGSFISTTGVAEGVREAVTTVRIDDWVRRQNLARLDLIKVDVEGAELRTLRGAVASISRFRPDLFMEINPITLRRFGDTDHRAVFDFLQVLFPSVGHVRADGTTEPIRNASHLDALLAAHGLLMACGTFGALPVAPTSRWRVGLLGRVADGLAARTAERRCPADGFVVEPAGRLAAAVHQVRGAPNQEVPVPVSVTNSGRAWWSSGFASHPVSLGYRWRSAAGAWVDGGRRVPLPHPVSPAGHADLVCPLRLPGQPGEHVAVVSLVQDGLTWFADVTPALGAEVTALVQPSTG